VIAKFRLSVCPISGKINVISDIDSSTYRSFDISTVFQIRTISKKQKLTEKTAGATTTILVESAMDTVSAISTN